MRYLFGSGSGGRVGVGFGGGSLFEIGNKGLEQESVHLEGLLVGAVRRVVGGVIVACGRFNLSEESCVAEYKSQVG